MLNQVLLDFWLLLCLVNLLSPSQVKNPKAAIFTFKGKDHSWWSEGKFYRAVRNILWDQSTLDAAQMNIHIVYFKRRENTTSFLCSSVLGFSRPTCMATGKTFVAVAFKISGRQPDVLFQSTVAKWNSFSCFGINDEPFTCSKYGITFPWYVKFRNILASVIWQCCLIFTLVLFGQLGGKIR